ncbi:MAG: MATE family efflux transporter [Pseudomonadales bacterium]|nr:MATE family efflux transporter [Pseudomonadales bacterium]MCP5182758.1 MATE family efflux transporter [Pseudomonadales bacterium]
MQAAATRTLFLEGPILSTLFKLATPNAMAFLVQAGVNMTEVWYVGQLGRESLAAMAFIFPGFMLVQMLANGSFGGATTSAMARALGAGDTARASQLVWHALAIVGVAGVFFAAVFHLFGSGVLTILGATGAIHDEALRYGTMAFSGAALMWAAALTNGCIRGTGNLRFPAMLMIVNALIQVPLSGGLILGWFGMPKLGLVGAAVSNLVLACVTTLVSLWKLAGPSTPVRLNWADCRLQWPLFRDILRVGALAAFSPIFTILTISVVNALIVGFGTATVAGYGIGARLEFLLVPMVFGFGMAMNAMVGMNIGNRNLVRAERIAFVGGLSSAIVTGVVGTSLAIFPGAWMNLFTSDAQVAAEGAKYLHFSGPVFAFQGMALALYFASQGAGTVLWPVIANFARFFVAGGAAALCVHVFNTSVEWVFASIAAGMLANGAITAGAIHFGAWKRFHRF